MSKSRSRLWIILVISTSFALGLVVHHMMVAPVAINQPTSPPPSVVISRQITTSPTSPPLTGGEHAKVGRVVDGDTIELTDRRKVRYIGINTPETVDPRKPVECYGNEAKAENTRLVQNKDVILVKDISETDTYGRLLRYVYVDGVFVNETLVRNGYAQVSSYPPDISRQEVLLKAQQQAREEGLGLWSGCITQTTKSAPTGLTISNGQVISSTKSISNTTGCQIKGNISSSGEKIYHLPGCGSYEKTVIDESVGEQWFCLETDAISRGWRKAKNCP